METNKATMNVTSPCAGRLEKFLVKLNESYPVGAVLGYLEVSEEEAARLGLDAPERQGRSDGKRLPVENGSAASGQSNTRR